MKRIRTLGRALLAATAASLALVAAAAPAGVPPAAPAASAPAQTDAQYAERVGEVKQALEAWRLAWELGDFNSYRRLYHPSFKGTAGTRKQWEQQRRARLARKDIGVKIENLEARSVGDSAMEVRFVQQYTAGGHKDTGEKRMTLRRDKGAWRITQESWRKR
jgi:murein L,D-transpeptidase YafK